MTKSIRDFLFYCSIGLLTLAGLVGLIWLLFSMSGLLATIFLSTTFVVVGDNFRRRLQILGTEVHRHSAENSALYFNNINLIENDFQANNKSTTPTNNVSQTLTQKTYDKLNAIVIEAQQTKNLEYLISSPMAISKLQNFKHHLSIYKDGVLKHSLMASLDKLIVLVASKKSLRQRSELVKILNDSESQSDTRKLLSGKLYHTINSNHGTPKKLLYYSHVEVLSYLISKAKQLKVSRNDNTSVKMYDSIIARNQKKLSLLNAGQKINIPNYYHATLISNALKILMSGKIQVRHDGLHAGAFVSTKPEIAFGEVVFAFSGIEIERKSALLHGFNMGDSFWAGFDHDVSLGIQAKPGGKYIKSNLAYLIVTNEVSEKHITKLRRELTSLGLEELEIISLKESTLEREILSSLYGGVVVPNEWDDDDEKEKKSGIQNPLGMPASQGVVSPSLGLFQQRATGVPKTPHQGMTNSNLGN